MVSRLWKVFQRYVRSLIRTFRITVQPLMPASILGKRRKRTELERFHQRLPIRRFNIERYLRGEGENILYINDMYFY